MKIELSIDGEDKIFTVPFTPMLAKRRYLELQAKAEEKEKNGERLTAQEQLDEDDEILAILTEVVFKNKITTDQVRAGASQKYIDSKLAEAVFGIIPKAELKEKENEEDSEGNEKGE